MYENNFHTKFSSTWFADLSIVLSSFYFFWSISQNEMKFRTKGFGRKSTEFYSFAVLLVMCISRLLAPWDKGRVCITWWKLCKSDYRKTPLISTYVFSGPYLLSGGMIRRSEKSCKEGVCSIQCFPHTTHSCACFSDYAHTSRIQGYL